MADDSEVTSAPHEMTEDRIVLVDGDEVFGPKLRDYLQAHGVAVYRLTDLADLFRIIATAPPRGVIIEQFVQGADSLAILPRLRQSYDGAVMIITGHSEATDRVLGLELGADDVVMKSQPLREILARVRAMLRRVGAPRPPPEPANRPHWRLDRSRRQLITSDNTAIHLTPLEMQALSLMEQQRGQVLSRDELSMTLLRRPYSPLDRAVDNLVAQLRKKLERFPDAVDAIKSVRGVGYVFVGFGMPPGS